MFGPGAARADVITDSLNTPVNGTAPLGAPAATVRDTGVGHVRLTMDATGLVASEFVKVWLFNLTPGWDFTAAPLSFQYVSGVQALQAVVGPADAYNGGPNVQAGLFDVLFTFPVSNSGDRLNGGDTSVYDVSAPGLSAATFRATSAPDGSRPGGYFSAADVLGIPSGGGTASGSVGSVPGPPPVIGFTSSVPEPGPLVLGGVAAAGALLARVWRRRTGRPGPPVQ